MELRLLQFIVHCIIAQSGPFRGVSNSHTKAEMSKGINYQVTLLQRIGVVVVLSLPLFNISRRWTEDKQKFLSNTCVFAGRTI